MIERFSMLFRTKRLAFFLAPFIILFALCANSSCGDSMAVTQNVQNVQDAQPVPSINFSSRRDTLNKFYEAGNDPMLLTCTMVTSRGSGGGTNDILGIKETYGFPVNLSSQVTGPGTPEPDGVYSSGTTDQTAFILRNGLAFVTEADTGATTGNCDPSIHPNTQLQRELDYVSAQAPVSTDMHGHVNFCPKNATCTNK